MLRRLRSRAGLTLAQMAERLDAKSLNAWARYEQGRAVPTIVKLTELFAAVAPGHDFVITESRSGR
jgi:transcriptional regulator with XRE-family HTH domain